MNNFIAQMKRINSYQPDNIDTLTKLETFLLLFLGGSVIGWIYELFFYWIFENRISNNGFFYGPYLPIYGFGTLFIILFTKRLKKYPFVIFLLTIPITGILEYVTGYLMYEIWATRWWDYRSKFCNIDGFVCIRSVLSFAVGSLLLIYFVEPFINCLSHKLSKRNRNILCISILFIFLIDILFTIMFRMPNFA